MWKVFLAFVVHRFFLVAAIFTILTLTLPEPAGHSTLPTIRPVAELWGHVAALVERSPDMTALQEARQQPLTSVFKVSLSPAVWIARVIDSVLPDTGFPSLLIVANLLCLLFLWELYALLSLIALPETAVGAAGFALLWITSYELSFGYSVSLPALLMLMAVRGGLDNRWFISGAALFFLALMSSQFLFLAPAILFIFFYFQQHFFSGEVLRRAAFVLVPVVAAVWWNPGHVPSAWALWQNSTLHSLLSPLLVGASWDQVYARIDLAQWFTIVFFTGGMLASLAASPLWIHRIIPINFWLLWLATSPLALLNSRAPLAAVCLLGVSSLSSGIVVRLIKAALLGLTIYELMHLFSAG